MKQAIKVFGINDERLLKVMREHLLDGISVKHDSGHGVKEVYNDKILDIEREAGESLVANWKLGIYSAFEPEMGTRINAIAKLSAEREQLPESEISQLKEKLVELTHHDQKNYFMKWNADGAKYLFLSALVADIEGRGEDAEKLLKSAVKIHRFHNTQLEEQLEEIDSQIVKSQISPMPKLDGKRGQIDVSELKNAHWETKKSLNVHQVTLRLLTDLHQMLKEKMSLRNGMLQQKDTKPLPVTLIRS